MNGKQNPLHSVRSSGAASAPRHRQGLDGVSRARQTPRFGVAPGRAPTIARVAPQREYVPQPRQAAAPARSQVAAPSVQQQTTSRMYFEEQAPPVLQRMQRVQPVQELESARWQRPALPHIPHLSQFHTRLKQWVSMQTKPQLVMMSAACFIFLFGLTVSIIGIKTNSQVEAQTEHLSQSGEDAGDHPDETDPGPNAVSNHYVDPSFPHSISIDKIGVSSRIKALGTKQNNELKAPTNIYDTGWYINSAKPGENGAMLLDGHVHGLTKPGVFYNLKKLRTGDEVTVQRGDGENFRYRVVSTQSYERDKLDMVAATTSIDSARPGLNIITCDGQLDKANNTYKNRLLVRAVLVD